jgi:ABC-type branched-subunit amino acid transport system substrate-binding protein
VALVLVAGGCATGEGIGQGAVLTVYVSAPLSGRQARQGQAMCRGARRELARSDGRAGSFRVRAVCLDDSAGAPHWSLAAVGANARHAVEDSTTIGYIGEPGAVASRFSRPIVETAGIPQLSTGSGAAAMRKLIGAIRRAGSPETSGDLRDSVNNALSGG